MKPRTRLVDLTLSEVSFVEAGDNPPAAVAMLKAQPKDKPMDSENTETVSKADYEAVQKELAELRKAKEELVEKAALDTVVEFCKTNALKPALAPHLRAVQKAAPEAYTALSAELVTLAKAAQATEDLTKRVSGVGQPVIAKSAAQIKLDELIAAEVAKGTPYATAAVKVYEANPSLYNEVANG